MFKVSEHTHNHACLVEKTKIDLIHFLPTEPYGLCNTHKNTQFIDYRNGGQWLNGVLLSNIEINYTGDTMNFIAENICNAMQQTTARSTSCCILDLHTCKGLIILYAYNLILRTKESTANVEETISKVENDVELMQNIAYQPVMCINIPSVQDNQPSIIDVGTNMLQIQKYLGFMQVKIGNIIEKLDIENNQTNK